MGTDSSASLVGELDVAWGGGLGPCAPPPPPEALNLELRLENHEGFLDSVGVFGKEPLLASPFLDSRVNPGLGGIGFGWVAPLASIFELSCESRGELGADESRVVWGSGSALAVDRRTLGDRSVPQATA